MEFKEFSEFKNPEEQDYDISSSLDEVQFHDEKNQNNQVYYEKLFDLIGILEDFTEEDLQRDYGISMQEYFNPTADTIRKVSEKIASINPGSRR